MYASGNSEVSDVIKTSDVKFIYQKNKNNILKVKLNFEEALNSEYIDS